MVRQLQRLVHPAPETAGREYDAICGLPLLDLEERLTRPIDAAPTMWPSWNACCRGWGGKVGLARGWYVVVGAKTGFGKSILAANLAAYAAKAGEVVALHSLEMDWDENAVRAIAVATRTPIWQLEPGTFDRAAFRNAAGEMEMIRAQTGGVIISNRHRIGTLEAVVDGIRKTFERSGARFHIVDYLQLAGVGRGYSDDILARTTAISNAVRALTKDLGIVTVGLSQFSREQTRVHERPRKEFLMGGSPLENDSVQTILLDHSRQWQDERGWRGYAIIDKNRHGPAGPKNDIPIYCSTTTLEMRERMPDEILADEDPGFGAPLTETRRRKS